MRISFLTAISPNYVIRVIEMSNGLTADKALIFRITHVDNVSWLLDNGLHCRNSTEKDPGFVNIGNLELIGKRHLRTVPIEPLGTLSDYVPFYFTPYSPMMLNIHTGYGVPQKLNKDIVILVTSLKKLTELNLSYLYTDRHAYLTAANFYDSLDSINEIDWAILQRKDFKRDIDDPEKVERYQAEALVHQSLDIDSLTGMVCYTGEVKEQLEALVAERGLDLVIHVRKNWYFR